MKTKLSAILVPLVIAACAPTAQPGMMVSEDTGSASLLSEVFPGSIFMVQLEQPVGGTVSPIPGGPVTATVLEPLHTAAGAVAIPAGARVEGNINGYYPAGGGLPAMVSVEFDRVVIGQGTYPMAGQVVHVDLAITDDGPTLPAGIVSLANPADVYPGSVVADAAAFLTENELGHHVDTAVSLGWDRTATLPQGTRLTLEFDPSRAM